MYSSILFFYYFLRRILLLYSSMYSLFFFLFFYLFFYLISVCKYVPLATKVSTHSSLILPLLVFMSISSCHWCLILFLPCTIVCTHSLSSIHGVTCILLLLAYFTYLSWLCLSLSFVMFRHIISFFKNAKVALFCWRLVLLSIFKIGQSPTSLCSFLIFSNNISQKKL